MYFSSSDDPSILSPRVNAALQGSAGADALRMIRDRDISVATLLQLSGPSATIEATIDDVIDEALAEALDSVAIPNLWAATYGTLSVGTPHWHPLPQPPTLGPLSLSLSQSVRIRGLPVGRCGDIGFVLCASLDPIFTVKTGSTKVFVNGRRAARALDLTIHGVPSAPIVKRGLGHLGPLVDVTRKSIGRYLESRPIRAESESRARMTAWTAKAREARSKAARATDSGSRDLDLAAARATANAEGAAATAAGQAQRATVAAGQAIADAGVAAFGALSKLLPAAMPSFGVLALPPNFSVTFAGLPMPGTGVGGRVTKLGKRVGGRAGRASGERTPRALRDGWASARLKLRAAGAPWRARIREAVPKPLRVLAGHPVDVVTGAVLTDSVDAYLRGRWTLPIRRHYSSAWARRSGPLGPGWSFSLDLAIWLEPGLLVHRAPDGRELFYDLPQGLDAEDPEALAQLVLNDPCNGLRIIGGAGGAWTLIIADGDAYSGDGIQRIDLAPLPGDPEATLRPALARARRLYGPEGATIDLGYDDEARLITARQGSRTLGVLWRRESRTLLGLTLPDTALPDEAAADRSPTLPDRQRLHTRYSFDEAGDLHTVTDGLGQRQELLYDAHRLTRETFADGRSFTFDYDERGPEARCVATLGDDGVFARTFAYEPGLGRTEIIDGLGARTLIRADERGRVVELTDAAGATTVLGYDLHGRRTLERDALGRETRYGYDELGRRRSVRLADGSTWSFDHTEEGRLSGATDGGGGRWRWRYDRQGRLIEALDPLGAAITYAYDDAGRRLEVLSDAAQRSINTLEVMDLSAAGDLLRRRLPGGSEWSYVYDPRGRCVEEIDPLGHRRRYTYDALDHLIAWIDADGERTVVDRDPAGRPLRILGPGRDITMTYGPCGRIASVLGDPRFPGGLTCAYDVEGRLLRLAHGELEHTFERDPAGAITGEVNSQGQARSFRRDRCGRVREVIGPGDGGRRYDYDENDRIIAIDYSDGGRERFSYGPRGELRQAIRDEERPDDRAPREPATRPSGPRAPIDAEPRPPSTGERPQEVQGTRAAAHAAPGPHSQENHRPRSEGAPSSTPKARPRPRPSPRPSPRPKLTPLPSLTLPPLPSLPESRVSLERPFDSAFDGAEAPLFEALAELSPRVAPQVTDGRLRQSVELERDPLGRVLGEVVARSEHPHRPAPSRWVAIERDRLGRPLRLGADTGPIFDATFARPSDRAPTTLDLRSGGRAWPLLSIRDRCGRERLRRSPGGVTVDLERDACGRTTLQRIRAGAESFGALFSEAPRELVVARYRWTRAIPARASLSQDGSPPQDAHGAHGAHGAHDPTTRPTSLAQTSGRDQDRDDRGRQTRRYHNGAALTLLWDDADRLRRVESDGSPTVLLDYDALGRRTRKRVGERTTTWLWEGDRPLIEEIREGDVLLSRRTWIFDPAPGRRFTPIAVIVDERLYCVHCDPLGAPLLATDTSGEIVWRRSLPHEALLPQGPTSPAQL